MQRRFFMQSVLAAIGVGAAFSAQAEAELLAADEAFQIRRALRREDWIEVDLWAAPGYAMYAERIRFQTDAKTVKVAAVELPRGEARWDEALGERLTYLRGGVRARVRLTGAAEAVALTVIAQGCADVGVCYPPVARTFQVGKVT